LSFTESIVEVPAGRRTTGRLRRAMGAAVGEACRSVAEVADSFGLSWPTAHAAFVEHADALLAAPEPTTVLGIDETRRGKPRWVRDSPQERWRRVDPYDTGFVDLAGTQGLLGQREGRTNQSVVDWLQERNTAVPGRDLVRRDRPGRRLRQGGAHRARGRDAAAPERPSGR